MSITLKIAALSVLLSTPVWAQTNGQGIAIVAAENFYGDVATQLAGSNATVSSILSNPDEDPHLFEASPSVAKNISAAQIVIYNGADYDPWMDDLLAAAKSDNRQAIVVADLVGKKAGDNPHLWYDPATMSALAKALSTALVTDDPEHKADYEARLQEFTQSLMKMDAKIGEVRKKFAGASVTATEPVFGYMSTALGLKMRNERFQLSVMNGTEPSASDIAAFENDLKNHEVKALLYNSQASDPAAERLLQIAKQANVPVVGVSETEPAGKTYQEWMLGQIDALEKALAAPSS